MDDSNSDTNDTDGTNDTNDATSDSDTGRLPSRPSLTSLAANTQLRHIAAILVILTLCASVIVEVLATGQIPSERVRRLMIFAGGLFGIARGLDLLNQLLNALNDS